MHPTNKYQSNLPYPNINISQPNQYYGEMILDNIGGINSEMSAISLYLYNQLITNNCFDEISNIFHQIMITEMHHLDIFGKIALDLGMDPKLWSITQSQPTYWSPVYNSYSNSLPELLNNALQGELNAIQKYQYQTTVINDSNIQEILQRIILDEQIHVEVFKELIHKYIEDTIFE